MWNWLCLPSKLKQQSWEGAVPKNPVFFSKYELVNLDDSRSVYSITFRTSLIGSRHFCLTTSLTASPQLIYKPSLLIKIMSSEMEPSALYILTLLPVLNELTAALTSSIFFSGYSPKDILEKSNEIFECLALYEILCILISEKKLFLVRLSTSSAYCVSAWVLRTMSKVLGFSRKASIYISSKAYRLSLIWL